MSRNWKKHFLGELAPYWTGKVGVEDVDSSQYVSTENMLVEKGGVSGVGNPPPSGKVTSYQKNDILVSNIRPYFKKIWFSDTEGACSNDILVFRPDASKVNTRFLYYALTQDSFFDYMMAGANGVKMPRGDKKSILKYEILLPPATVQNRISSILASYDNLIENNLKRISLLEEMAQITYEQWFVRMKYLDHEASRVNPETGLPVGWVVRKLDDVFDFSNGHAFYTKGYSEEGVDVIDLGNISISSDLIISGNEKKISNELYQQSQKFHLDKYDVVVAMTDMTKELGILAKSAIIDKDESYVLNQRVGRLRSRLPIIDYSFVYATLNDRRFIQTMHSVSKGAVQFYFNTKDIANYKVVLPTDELISSFQEVYRPLLEIRLKLKEQNALMSEAREVLLPRLMNGIIHVDQMEPPVKLHTVVA